MPWANGRGVTAEICVSPAAPQQWSWRLSIADVPDDGAFSMFHGVTRHIMVVDGVGMGLTIDGSVEQRVEFGSAPLSFAGDAKTTCRLLDGPVTDLNLMVRRAAGAGALLVERVSADHRLVDADLVGSHPGVAMVVVRGVARVGTYELAPFDAVLLEVGDPMPDVVAVIDSIIAIATFTEFTEPYDAKRATIVDAPSGAPNIRG